ncbi:MAG: hypothetical protein WBW33_02100 [Bryobacteraceae bacterium]
METTAGLSDDPSAQLFPASLDRIQIMPRLLTADDIMPLVASLPDSERIRLLRWIASPHGTDASAYRVAPPTNDEFSGDDEPLAWEAEGWEEFH